MPRADEVAEAPAVAGPPTVGRRERRRREIRDRLYETAIELFLEQGYERTTMDEIGNRADVARTTVFNHYPRKPEFLSEWGARRRAKVAAALRQRQLNDKPIDVILESYMELMAEVNEEHRAETKALMSAAIAYDGSLNNPPLAATLTNYIRRAQEGGQVRAGVDPDQAGLMLAATYFATLISWADHDPPAFELGWALKQTVELILRGLTD